MNSTPTTGGLSTGAQAGVIVAVIGGVFLLITVPVIIFSIYMHRQQKTALRAVTQHRTEQALEQASTQLYPRKTQWTESIDAVERQRSLATATPTTTSTTTTADTASEISVRVPPRKGLFVPSLPKMSIMSVIVKPKQTIISTIDLEQGRRNGTEETRESHLSLAEQHQTEQRAWHTAAVGQWLF